MTEVCNRAPIGWWCSREPDHEGSRAARPRWWMRLLRLTRPRRRRIWEDLP